MRHFKTLDCISVLLDGLCRGDDTADRRQCRDRVNEFINCPIQMRPNQRPRSRDYGAGSIVDLKERESGFKPDIAFRRP